MKLIIEYYDIKLDEQEIINFFNLFSDITDTIIFYKLNIPNTENNKRRKLKKDSSILEHIISKLEQVTDKSSYNIYLTKSSIKSIFGEYSDSEIINLLYKHIAFHFGYNTCKCSGFTVKDKDNKKIKVEEIVYIKNEYNFYVPENLVFVKTDKKLKSPATTNYIYKTDFKTKSLILYSIL